MGTGSSCPPQKGHSRHNFRPMAWWIKMPLGREVGLGAGHIALDGELAPPTERDAAAPTFWPMSYCGWTVAHLSYCWALVWLCCWPETTKTCPWGQGKPEVLQLTQKCCIRTFISNWLSCINRENCYQNNVVRLLCGLDYMFSALRKRNFWHSICSVTICMCYSLSVVTSPKWPVFGEWAINP